MRFSPRANVQQLPDILARSGVPDVDVLSQRAHEVGGTRVVLGRWGNEEFLRDAIPVRCRHSFGGVVSNRYHLSKLNQLQLRKARCRGIEILFGA